MPAKHKQTLKAFALPGRLEAGADEAGRGSLISRVMVGAVIFPPEVSTTIDPDNLYSRIRDSKKVPPTERDKLYDYICENAVAYSVGWADEREIDEINIRNATMKAFHRAIDELSVRPDHLLIDGPYFEPYTCPIRHVLVPHTCVIQGDNAFVAIAAAAIVAKVTRDRYIKQLCENDATLDARYGLMTNMGYGTAEHIKGIQKWGPTPHHRMSFGVCKNGTTAAEAARVTPGQAKLAILEWDD